MISEEIPFQPSNALQVFAYEGFQYTISNVPGFTLQNVSSVGSGLTPESLYFTKNGNISYIFGVSDASSTLTPSTRPESFTLTTVSGSTVLTSSNLVTINGGRFLDGSGNSLSNNSYVFFKNEPITPITLVAPFTLKTPISIPALPPGLSFVRDTSSIFKISGTPSVTVPNSNYQIIGTQQGGSKIVTTRFNMVVSNERLRLNLLGSSIINNMEIGTDISSRVITAIPSAGSSQVRYTFPAFPDGIVVTDLSGVVQSTPFIPTDPSYTFILSGAPTSNAAYEFSSIISGTPEYTVQAARTIPLPIVENSQSFNFGFAPTILFDLSGVPPLYTNIAFDPSSIFFRAQTYFTTDTSITSIFSSDLRSDLSLVFVSNEARAYLKGITDNKATSAGSATFTISAIDTDLNTRDYPVLINVVDDSVSFSSPVGDICVNYILSRPTSNFKDGYYTSNIQFTATANSKLPVTFSAPALSNTGLSLSNGLLTGIPSTIVPLTDLVVTANVSGSPATASKTIKFAILDDSFNFVDVSASSLDFIQNVQITPFRFPVTTLSERTIINYSQTGFPSGLSINPAGVVSGTPTSSSPTAGNVTISATTGFATGTRDFSYNLIPDSMLFVVNPTNYDYQAGNSIPTIDIEAVTFSGTTVSNYDLSINPTYGMVINSSNGNISGTWTTGIPPAVLLPSSCNFTVTAQAGQLSGALSAQLNANPIVENAMLFAGFGGSIEQESWLYSTSSSNISSFTYLNVSSSFGFGDIQFKNNDPENNVILASSGLGVFRGTRLDNLFFIPFPEEPSISIENQVSSLVNIPGTSNWKAGGRRGSFDDDGDAVLFSSTDDGLTWDTSDVLFVKDESGFPIKTRDDGSNTFDDNPYLYGGLALKYDSDTNTLIAGGLVKDGVAMGRSVDGGSNWTTMNGGFSIECGYLSLDNSSVWVATGSDKYKTFTNAPGAPSGPPPFLSGGANTIKYSLDYGANWSDASGTFNMYGYELVYANNTWLATGVSSYNLGGQDRFVPELRYSTNGSDWEIADLSTNNLFNPSNLTALIAPLRIGSMNFDGNHWNVFVNVEPQVSGGGSVPTLYRHDASSSLASGWFAIDISSSLTAEQPSVNSNLRFLTFTPPKFLYTGEPPINIGLSFVTISGTGPTFTSPTSLSYIQYQYISINPIQITATGTGQVYLFVTTADLPPGLTFNQLTGIITGTPVRAGNDSVTIFAKDDNGVSSIILNFTILVPRVIRKQDGAGAYTSLLRQYTEVLGAQNARDNRVLPNQERALGEFMSPEAPDVITQVIDPKCRNPNC
jgi:hypothetical protein